MARPLRIEFPGAIYHVSSRMLGSWQQSRDWLFRDERDRERFLQRLCEGVTDFGIRFYLFTLMSNHYHLVLETPAQRARGYCLPASAGAVICGAGFADGG